MEGLVREEINKAALKLTFWKALLSGWSFQWSHLQWFLDHWQALWREVLLITEMACYSSCWMSVCDNWTQWYQLRPVKPQLLPAWSWSHLTINTCFLFLTICGRCLTWQASIPIRICFCAYSGAFFLHFLYMTWLFKTHAKLEFRHPHYFTIRTVCSLLFGLKQSDQSRNNSLPPLQRLFIIPPK